MAFGFLRAALGSEGDFLRSAPSVPVQDMSFFFFFFNLFILRVIPHIQGNCAPPLITHRREVAYMKAKRTWLLEIGCSGH